MEMTDAQLPELDAVAGAEAEYRFSFSLPPTYPMDTYYGDDGTFAKRFGNPSCRIRYGRGGRLHLETKKSRPRGAISRGVVSDSESDDDIEDYYAVSETKAFDYRCALNARPRADGGRPSGDQTAIMAGAQAAAASQAANSSGG
jgi:enhancer of polycomb-like protein